MLSDEEEANEVIKVSNLVAKFESEIRRQNADERLIHTVRQVLRESRKVKKHPLQEHEGEERSDFIISTADVKPGPDHDLSICTDKPRVKTRVLQHNRFTQLREKCSEIITKSVRNRSKPNQNLPPRPNSFSQNTNQINWNSKSDFLPDRRATFDCNRSPKTYELKDVNDIGEGFEIINIDDCVSDVEDGHRRSPRVEPLNLSNRNSRNGSLESLDSGCDIETPRANLINNQVRMFQELSLDDNDGKKIEGKNVHKSAVVETKVVSNDVTRSESNDSANAINVVCNIQLVSNNVNVSPDHDPEVSQKDADKEQDNSDLGLRDDSQNQSQSFEQDEIRSSEEDEDIPLQFSEIFKLFEPNKNIDEDVSQYAQDLRAKLAWKIAAEKVLRSNDAVSQEELKDASPEKFSEVSKPPTLRSECPAYDDPELDEFISRCFGITCSVHENISDLQESEESLLNCFIPKELLIPEVSGLDLKSVDSASMDSLSWSDGEYLDIND